MSPIITHTRDAGYGTIVSLAFPRTEDAARTAAAQKFVRYMFSPNAYINDGLLDAVIILEFSLVDVAQVVSELLDPTIKGEFVKRFQTTWVESIPKNMRFVNLDGEPYEAEKIHFEILPKEIEMVLPKNCPCLLP